MTSREGEAAEERVDSSASDVAPQRSDESRISGVVPLGGEPVPSPAVSAPVTKPPPPRRPRPPAGAELAEHEAFKLERPRRVSEPQAPSAPVARAASPIMLPPPPGPQDYEPERAPERPRRKPAPARSERALLTELPSLDPFEGLGRVAPSGPRPWLVLLLGAFAFVGVAALLAVVFGFVGRTGW